MRAHELAVSNLPWTINEVDREVIIAAAYGIGKVNLDRPQVSHQVLRIVTSSTSLSMFIDMPFHPGRFLRNTSPFHR